MVKLSRYFLVIIAILGFAVALPKLYWTAFAKPINAPLVLYSCIENDFMILRNSGETKRTNTKGKEYTREEYEQRLPFMYTRQLLMAKTMPDSINGVEMDLHAINFANSTFRLRPQDLDSPQPSMYPLFESQSGRANLEMPEDYFRITWRMEFIDAKRNKIIEEKSKMFSAVLYKRGFKFPAKSINGLPTTRKSCDEGYFVVDAENQLFHVKMIKGEPYVKKIDLPDGIIFKNISCVDFRDKKFYAYLFTAENQLYVLTQDDYELIHLPVESINPAKNQVRVFGNLFHYNILEQGENFLKVTVLDSDFKNVDVYNENWLSRKERKEGRIFGFLFPGQISMTSTLSGYNRFYADINNSLKWLILGLLLVLIQIYIVYRRKAIMKSQVMDLCLIAVTGIFGFLAVNIFPNKFFGK